MAAQTVHWGSGEFDIADVRMGRANYPLLLVIHGGFWTPEYDRGHLEPMLEALTRQGFTTAAPEYRRIPGDPDATLHDVAQAMAALPTLVPGHDGRVVVLGHSAGGHLALWSAAHCPAPGLVRTVALAPVADLVQAHDLGLGDGAVRAFLGGGADSRPDLDPTAGPTPATEVLLVHGDADEIVPLSQSVSYVKAHPHTRLITLPRGDHFVVIQPESRHWPHVVAAATLLAPAAGPITG